MAHTLKEGLSLLRSIWSQEEEFLLPFAYTIRVVWTKTRSLITLVWLNSGLQEVFVMANLWSGYDPSSSSSLWDLISFLCSHADFCILVRNSNSSELRDRLIQDSGTGCRQIKKVNSVIFVVNAAEVLKSMESKTSYAHMISTAFSCPLLLFKGRLVRFYKLQVTK